VRHGAAPDPVVLASAKPGAALVEGDAVAAFKGEHHGTVEHGVVLRSLQGGAGGLGGLKPDQAALGVDPVDASGEEGADSMACLPAGLVVSMRIRVRCTSSSTSRRRSLPSWLPRSSLMAMENSFSGSQASPAALCSMRTMAFGRWPTARSRVKAASTSSRGQGSVCWGCVGHGVRGPHSAAGLPWGQAEFGRGTRGHDASLTEVSGTTSSAPFTVCPSAVLRARRLPPPNPHLGGESLFRIRDLRRTNRNRGRFPGEVVALRALA